MCSSSKRLTTQVNLHTYALPLRVRYLIVIWKRNDWSTNSQDHGRVDLTVGVGWAIGHPLFLEVIWSHSKHDRLLLQCVDVLDHTTGHQVLPAIHKKDDVSKASLPESSRWEAAATCNCCTPSPSTDRCVVSWGAVSASPQSTAVDRFVLRLCRFWSPALWCLWSWTPETVTKSNSSEVPSKPWLMSMFPGTSRQYLRHNDVHLSPEFSQSVHQLLGIFVNSNPASIHKDLCGTKNTELKHWVWCQKTQQQ